MRSINGWIEVHKECLVRNSHSHCITLLPERDAQPPFRHLFKTNKQKTDLLYMTGEASYRRSTLVAKLLVFLFPFITPGAIPVTIDRTHL